MHSAREACLIVANKVQVLRGRGKIGAGTLKSVAAADFPLTVGFLRKGRRYYGAS